MYDAPDTEGRLTNTMFWADFFEARYLHNEGQLPDDNPFAIVLDPSRFDLGE